MSTTADVQPAPWSLPGALLQLVTFEVDVQATLDHLPDVLSRPAPPYARIQVADYPDSPVGPYREATLLVSARYLMLPRQYVAASIVTSDRARDANAAVRRYASEVGEVRLERSGNEFTGFIRTSTGLEIRISSTDAQGTSPAVIRYDPTVVVQPGSGGPEVVTVSTDPNAVHEAWLAIGTTVSYSGGQRAEPWLRLRSRNPITCTIARLDLEVPEPQPVRPMAAAAGGGP